MIKQERRGNIKGITYADGIKQKRFMKDGETISSSTVSTEVLMKTLIIDTMEGQDVTIFYVPGAYFHAEIPEEKKVTMKKRG